GTDDDPLRFVPTIRCELMAVDRNQTITAVRTMNDVIYSSEGRRRSVLLLLGGLAGVGALLAMLGIYGVIAVLVAQRARELSIRRALGARDADILRLVVGQGIRLATVGTIVGI